MNKKIILMILGFALVFEMMLASGAEFFSGTSYGFNVNYQSQPDFTSYYGARVSDYWPIIAEKEQCLARQDFILQVAPGGCMPMVVRSDLLAEQNVPVFCQIDAMQINPILNVKSIDNIRFTGKYPNEVAGVGFHPAQAALRTRDTLLGNPLINNIGYAVVILKRNPNEKDLPDYIEVNLTGQIEYESGNALGIGRTEFLLKEVSDDDWEREKLKYGFWNGRYFLRLEGIDANIAYLGVYEGDVKVGTMRAEKGKTSESFYLPGMYCQAGLEAYYAGFEAGVDRAKIEVTSSEGTSVFEVSKGSKFDNDRFSVSEVIPSSIKGFGSVKISCRGAGTVTLDLKPYDESFTEPDGKTAIVPEQYVKEGKALYWYVEVEKDAGSVKKGFYGIDKDNNFYFLGEKKINDKKIIVNSQGEIQQDYSGEWYKVMQENLKKLRIYIESKGKGAEVESLLTDVPLPDDDAEKEFNDAINAYIEVAKNYPSERKLAAEASDRYGEIALREALELARNEKVSSYKKGTQARILSELIEIYPDSKYIEQYKRDFENLVKINDENAVMTAKIDNKYRTIRLTSVEKGEAASADFRIDNMPVSLGVGEDSATAKARDKATSIRLNKVTGADEVQADIYCKEREGLGSKWVRKELAKTMRVGDDALNFCGKEYVKLEKVSATQVAKVVLTPKVSGTKTETNVILKIGIEKRGIKLSPDRKKDMIKNINESIKKFEDISERLGKVVTGLKATCLATSVVLIAKNMISGFSGTSLAREQAMSGPNGWIEKCKLAVTSKTLDGKSVDYVSITDCLNKNGEKINQEIDVRKNTIGNTNKVIKEIEAGKTAEGKNIITKGSIFTGDRIDSQAAAQKLLEKLKADERFKDDARVRALEEKDAKGRAAYSYGDLRDLYYNLELEGSGVVSGGKDAMKISERISDNQRNLDEIHKSENTKGLLGRDDNIVASSVPTTIAKGRFYEVKNNKMDEMTVSGAEIEGKTGVIFIGKESKDQNARINNYLIVGSSEKGRLKPEKAYIYKEENGRIILSALPDGGSAADLLSNNDVRFIDDVSKTTTYNTPIGEHDAKVRYFDTEPYKGMPALVPFDIARGWYAKVEPKLGIAGTMASYDKSGLPRSWKICNVGSDGVIGVDDDCQIVEEGITTGVTVLGQDSATSRKLIQDSRQALLQAAEQRDARDYVSILGNRIKKDDVPAAVVDAMQCQEFMSILDCRILFNVCDPVICPASRCDFGGKYRVADVIQSGVIGSALLCLPNIREPIFIPVCLTGIQAGIDGYVSLLKNHRDCLQNNLDRGEMTGICDEIYSVYKCEFFWRQIAPIANLMIPKIIGMAYGESRTRGGGEYLNVARAWDNAKKSMDYFTQTYATNIFKAFNIKSIEQAGTEFCRGSISANIPKGLKSLAEPESPPQFHGWFDSVTYTSATIPATAQYKVFYHIYAGKTAGVSYQIYLKSPPESAYYRYSETIAVATGYIAAGEYASDTKDFTAPEGYKEMCIRINNEEKCGFKQVSTSFAVNYLRDEYAKETITEEIKTEQKCTSGSPGLGAFMTNINPQSMIEEALMPQDYKRGIIRICASKNPGASTDLGRYQDVGYCGDKNLRCWLDKESVDRAISAENIGARNATLEELDEAQKKYFREKGYLVDNDADAELREFEERAVKLPKDLTSGKANLAENRKKIEAFLKESGDLSLLLVLNHHKARLALIEADASGAVIKTHLASSDVVYKKLTTITPAAVPAAVAPAGVAKETTYSSIITVDFGAGITAVDYRFNRNLGKWQYNGGFGWGNVEDMGWPYATENRDIAKKLYKINEEGGYAVFREIMINELGAKISGLSEESDKLQKSELAEIKPSYIDVASGVYAYSLSYKNNQKYEVIFHDNLRLLSFNRIAAGSVSSSFSYSIINDLNIAPQLIRDINNYCKTNCFTKSNIALLDDKSKHRVTIKLPNPPKEETEKAKATLSEVEKMKQYGIKKITYNGINEEEYHQYLVEYSQPTYNDWKIYSLEWQKKDIGFSLGYYRKSDYSGGSTLTINERAIIQQLEKDMLGRGCKQTSSEYIVCSEEAMKERVVPIEEVIPCRETKDCQARKPGYVCTNNECSQCITNYNCESYFGAGSGCKDGKCVSTILKGDVSLSVIIADRYCNADIMLIPEIYPEARISKYTLFVPDDLKEGGDYTSSYTPSVKEMSVRINDFGDSNVVLTITDDRGLKYEVLWRLSVTAMGIRVDDNNQYYKTCTMGNRIDIIKPIRLLPIGA